MIVRLDEQLVAPVVAAVLRLGEREASVGHVVTCYRYLGFHSMLVFEHHVRQYVGLGVTLQTVESHWWMD